MKAKYGVNPEEVKQSGKHVLFVEGKDPDSFDVRVFSELLDGKIQIEPLGQSCRISSVAEALYPYHPTYYFIIDRDLHYRDNEIDRYWDDFPDPQKKNLLIWKCREIENYFLEPAYLLNSDYINTDKKNLRKKIIESSKKRLFLDMANYVVVEIRERIKDSTLQIFKHPDEFSNKTQAEKKLLDDSFIKPLEEKIGSTVCKKFIKSHLDQIFIEMTGGNEKLQFGKGKWLEMISGKKVLKEIVNSNCFKVLDIKGNPLDGKDKLNIIVKDLLGKDIKYQPKDFQKLKDLIYKRLDS